MRGVRIEITGPMASGKTTTAALITRALRDAGFDVQYEDDGWFVERTVRELEVTSLQSMLVVLSSMRYAPGDPISAEMARNSNNLELADE